MDMAADGETQVFPGHGEATTLEAERAAIRESLGYKFEEEEIVRLLNPENVDKWFSSRMAWTKCLAAADNSIPDRG